MKQDTCSPVTHSTSNAPYVNGNKIYHGDGRRLIIKGVNLECGRYDDSIYHQWWSDEYEWREKIANTISENGFNLVRLNAGAAAYKADPSHFDKLEEVIKLYASKGVYSMPTTHDYTGSIPDVEGLKLFFSTLIHKARSGGYERWIILNPWNEGVSYPWSTWVYCCEKMLDFIRVECGFQGIVAFDTPVWGAAWDSSSIDQVIAYDEKLQGTSCANLVVANHWYPWTGESAKTISANCKKYPMLVGELGRWVDEQKPNSAYALELIDHICKYNIEDGHNGIIAWMWRWCDWGTMTDEGDGDGTVLNSDWGIPAVRHMIMEATLGV